MANWELLEDEAASRVWDENLMRFGDASPFQTYAWGEYNRALGWQPRHLIVRNEAGEITAMMLGLLRRFPMGIGLLWCEGGPAGEIENWGESLQTAARRHTGLKHLYLRFRCDRPRNVSDALFLRHKGWTRSFYTMNSGYTLELDLSASDETFSAKFAPNWQRNFSASRKKDLRVEVCSNPNIEELCEVFAEMETHKNLPPLFPADKLRNIFGYAASNLIFVQCRNASGKLLSFRACLVIGSRACDYMAATSAEGRRLRASYLTFRRLLELCREQKIDHYDLGGIDPWANPGVYNFKKETGAVEVEALGEWDWATSGWMRLLGNWAISQKNSLKQARQTVSFSCYNPFRRLPKSFNAVRKLKPKKA